MVLSHEYPCYYRCFAAVNMDAIQNNLMRLKSCLNPGVKALAVVKADAYGHGSQIVSKVLEPDVDYFAVASLEEGIELRESGIKKPILILSYTAPVCYDALVDYDLTATVYSIEDGEKLSEIALLKGKKATVHVPVDTGMGRIGVTPDAAGAEVVLAISQLNGINIEGLFSHYACADAADKRDAEAQTALFDSFISLLDEKKISIPLKHICNSAGAMELPKQYDMCRLGIALYGLYPSDEVDREKISLMPAMEVVSHVVHVKKVPKGFKIGYGHIYEAPSERVIATVSVGYADGYNRCMTGVGYVLINGKKAPVVGRVCMDQIMVDVTDHQAVSVGDHAVIIGKSGEEEISAEDFGAMCHSFNYEVVCNFMPRVKRIYYKNGKLL